MDNGENRNEGGWNVNVAYVMFGRRDNRLIEW